MELTLPAPAKLNLFLHAVGRRPDGYHLLQSVFRLIDFGDTVHLAARDDGAIRRLHDLPGVPEEADLTLRAARLLREATGCRRGVDIRLDKRLPVGGGLGGGSSDAATVLLGLNRLWELGLARAELQALGLRLGADVPFFVFGRNAFVEGVGEALQPVDLAPAWYAVIVPPAPVSTASIFAAPELTRDRKITKMRDFSEGCGVNDLQPVVLARYPRIGAALARLTQAVPEARRAAFSPRMTGSGCCVFARLEDETEARRVLEQRPEDCGGFVARGLSRHPLIEFAD
jgi:4-diphosphocytidyl-2-C-methyl-D-erythritol kinase